MGESPLDRVRRVCLALPQTSEQLAWGEPTFRVRGKLFTMFAGATRHGGGRDALWCHASPVAQRGLIEAAADRFFLPPYVGKSGWIGLWLDRVDDGELEMLVRQASCGVASVRLQALLDSPEES